MQTNRTYTRSLQIILAITAKDILDAVRNRTILSQLVTALFLSAFFTIMPLLSDTGTPLVFLADAGQSSYSARIKESDALTIRFYPTEEAMKADFILRADNQLGLVLPSGFDQAVARGETPVIQGYVLSWVKAKTVAEKKANIESRLGEIIGSQVRIDMAGGTLYMQPDSNGGFLEATGIMIILLITGMYLVPILMLEEKRTRTLEALLVSPANSSQIAISKTLTGIFYVSIFAILVVAANGYLVQQWGLIIVSALLSIMFSVSVGLLLGILVENLPRLFVTTQILLIPIILPVLLVIIKSAVPAWLSSIARWVPTTAIFDLLRISFSNQLELGEILPRLGLLLISSVILFGLSARLIQHMER